MNDQNNNKTIPIRLLLNHIISTFNAKLGMLWIAETGSFYISTKNGGHSTVNTDTLVHFLSGYYYRFMQAGHSKTPLLVENLYDMPNHPENLIKLAKVENITSLVISPILLNNYVKGTIILGFDNVNIFINVNYDLLKLLTNLASYLNENNHTSYDIKILDQTANSFNLIVGKNQQMQEIYKTILKISQSDTNVFIYGESGTGKELVARTIHFQSVRKNHPFIPVDCVALPGSLLESELFGHEKGAFTGASNIKRGLIEYADKGTFFLDEIAEMNIELQAKLLRVLQERQFRRLGGMKLIDVDIRIVSATNRDPNEAVSNKTLREDLFYRLNVIPLYVPPLRERKEDIPVFVEHYIKEFSKSNEGKSFNITEAAMQYLINYHWPGNVRELRNVIERLTALAKNDMFSVEDLPDEIVRDSSAPQSKEGKSNPELPYIQAKRQNLMTFERKYFSQLLDRYNGNISRVAKEAKVSRKTIYNILQKHSLDSYQNSNNSVWQSKLQYPIQ